MFGSKIPEVLDCNYKVILMKVLFNKYLDYKLLEGLNRNVRFFIRIILYGMGVGVFAEFIHKYIFK